MNELIKIRVENGRQVVSARELYEFLGYDVSNWKRWYIKNISDNEFVTEGDDWVSLVLKTRGADVQDFAITISFAKKLSMMAKTAKGEDARNYFLECERKVKENTIEIKPMTQFEFMQMSLDKMIEQDRKLKELQKDVDILKINQTSATTHFTIVGYCSMYGISVNITEASAFGRQATIMCRNKGLSIGSTADPRFGRINTYPEHILDELFTQPLF